MNCQLSDNSSVNSTLSSYNYVITFFLDISISRFSKKHLKLKKARLGADKARSKHLTIWKAKLFTAFAHNLMHVETSLLVDASSNIFSQLYIF